jgi:hypothetical protein
MNCLRRSILPLALVLASVAHAQYAPPPPARPFPGFVNEKLRAKDVYLSAWDVATNVRVRVEDKQGAGFTDAGSNWDFDASGGPARDNNNLYTVTRVMPRVAYTGKWFAATVEARFSESLGDERFNTTAPGNALADRDSGGDLHQAFVLIGNHKEFPLSLKIGRQELVYGDQRLVGHFRWGNNARTFDAVKLRWQNPLFGVDVFTGGVVYNDNRNLNHANSQDHFSGAYFNFPTASTKSIVEAYFLARNVERGIATDDWSGVPAPFRFPGAQDVYTVGLRLKSKPGAIDPWDYGLETMYQFGNRTAVFAGSTVAAALAAPRLSHHASAVVAQLGYTWTENAWQPRLAAIYSYGSGDTDATDSKSGTFQNLFPTNHLFYGYMDLNSLQNIHDVRLAFTMKPVPTAMLALEGHVHHLDTTSDFWYNVAGVPRNFTGAAVGSGRGYRVNPSYSGNIGEELDVVSAWTFRPYAQIEAAACQYFRGGYVKDSLAAVGSKNANYFYLQLTLNL